MHCAGDMHVRLNERVAIRCAVVKSLKVGGSGLARIGGKNRMMQMSDESALSEAGVSGR